MGKLNRAEIHSACHDVQRHKKDRTVVKQEYPSKNMLGPIVRYTEQGNPVKVWASHLDANAWTQAESFADMSFVHPKGLALMPDVHFGKGVPVGSVLPTVGAIVPAAVGTDVGCGNNGAHRGRHCACSRWYRCGVRDGCRAFGRQRQTVARSFGKGPPFD